MSYLTCSVYCSHSTCRWCSSGQQEGGLSGGQHYFALVLETNHKNRLGKELCPWERRDRQHCKSPFKGNTTASFINQFIYVFMHLFIIFHNTIVQAYIPLLQVYSFSLPIFPSCHFPPYYQQSFSNSYKFKFQLFK